MRLPLTETDLFLTAAGGGDVTEREGYARIRTPDNPGFFHGNYLLLPGPPDDLAGWMECAARELAGSPGGRHTCLRWDGPALSPAAVVAARAAGFVDDSGISMAAADLAVVTSDLHIRPLDMVTERAAITALNRSCDLSELDGDPHYVAFKEGRRRAWWRWAEAGVAVWWGAFEGECLIAQCGLVRCPEGRGRFQSVETHPDHRRRGACSALISAAGRSALEDGCVSLHLAADGDGPARALYRRLGFVEDGWQCSLLHGGGSLIVRPATQADHSDIRSLTLAAAPETLPAVLAALTEPGTTTVVAVRSGTPHGHAIFRAGEPEPIALVVRPTQDTAEITALLLSAMPG